MTGDSENEIESPGGSTVPSAEPRPDGENSFRPFRGWASAYEPAPSLWSRISGIFSRKRKVEHPDEVVPESPNSLLADAHELADVDAQAGDAEPDVLSAEPTLSFDESPVAPPDDFRFPFVRPESADSVDASAIDESRDVPADEPMDEPMGEPVAETVDELYLASADDHVASIPVVDESPAPRRGFFSRLFSRRAVPQDEPLAEDAQAETIEALDVVRDEPVEPEIPAFLHEPPRHSRPIPAFEPEADAHVDRPNLDDPAFFVPEDVEPAPSRDVPSLDDALPAAQAADPLQEGEVWADGDVEPASAEAPKAGFFSRLIQRFSRPLKQVAEPDPDVVDVEPASDLESVQAEESLTHADEALAAADDFFVDDAPASDQRFAPPTFETIDEALPAPDVSSYRRARDPEPEPLPDLEPEPASAAGSDFLFGDTIDPMDVVPTVGSPTMEEIVDARPTVETTPPRDTVRADILDEESTDEFVQPVPPEVDAAAEAERPPFFVPKFRSFYNEIVLYKHQKSQFTGGFATAIVDYTSDLSPDAAAQGLSKRLQEILELQHAEAMWMGGEAAGRYPDAQYAMAVLADELFTHMEWPGQAAWPKYLLEPRMFRTHAADVEFFKRVDRLLKNEVDSPSRAARDLARLYLLVLASGFRGKYRQPNLTRPLAEYRRRLYEFIYEGDSLMLYAPERRLFPEATERTLESKAVARFSGLQQWAAALIVILVGYTLLANMAWRRVSADLTDVTARVEAASRTTSSDGSWGSVREDSLR